HELDQREAGSAGAVAPGREGMGGHVGISWRRRAGARGSLNDNRRMPARLSAFVIWALVAASAVFWGLRLVVRAPGAPAHTVAVGDTAPLRADLTRLFGAPMVAVAPTVVTPAANARF